MNFFPQFLQALSCNSSRCRHCHSALPGGVGGRVESMAEASPATTDASLTAHLPPDHTIGGESCAKFSSNLFSFNFFRPILLG